MVQPRTIKCSLDALLSADFTERQISFLGKLGVSPRKKSSSINRSYNIEVHGLEVLPLSKKKSQLSSLYFVANRFCMKLLKTSDIQTVKFCGVHFNFELPSKMLICRYEQFLDNATAKTDLVKYCCVQPLSDV